MATSGSEKIAEAILVDRLRTELGRAYTDAVTYAFEDFDKGYAEGLRFALDLLPKQRTPVQEAEIDGVPLVVGGAIKLLPSRKGKHDGGVTTIRSIIMQDDQVVEVEVIDPKRGWAKSVTPDRLAKAPRKRNSE